MLCLCDNLVTAAYEIEQSGATGTFPAVTVAAQKQSENSRAVAGS